MSAQGEAKSLAMTATTRRSHPARATARKPLWRLVLFLLLLVALFALHTSPALADSVQADAYGWFKYSSGIVHDGGLSWYGYWGYFTDVDAGAANTQILISNTKPVDSIFFLAERYNTGVFHNICCIYSKAA